MSWKTVLRVAFLLGAIAVLTGCGTSLDGASIGVGGDGGSDDSGSSGSGDSGRTGELRVHLTDAPIGYDALWVTIEEIAVHRAGRGWFVVPFLSPGLDVNCDGVPDSYLESDGAVTVDLLALRDLQVLFASATLPAGRYTQFRWRVRSAEGEIDGVTTPLFVPSGVQSGIKFRAAFRVLPDEVTSLLLDFDAEASIVPRERSGQPPILKPVIRLVPGFDGAGSGPLWIEGHSIPMRGDHVTYVMDRSGSMAWTGGTFTGLDGQPTTGSRWDRSVAVVVNSIRCLPEQISFNIVTFACNRDALWAESQPATPENKLLAEDYVLLKRPFGGTGTAPAVVRALEEWDTLDVVLLTDGQPNCGGSGTEGPMETILDANLQGAAIHTYGIAHSGTFSDWLAELSDRTGGVHIVVDP